MPPLPDEVTLHSYLTHPYRVYPLPWKIFVGKKPPICVVTDVYSNGWFHTDQSVQHCTMVLRKRGCVFLARRKYDVTIHFLTDTTSVTCIGYKEPMDSPLDWAQVYGFSENPRSIVDSQPPLFFHSGNYTVFPSVALSACVVMNDTHVFPQNIFIPKSDLDFTYVPLAKIYTSSAPNLGDAIRGFIPSVYANSTKGPLVKRTHIYDDFDNQRPTSTGLVVGFSPNAYEKVCVEGKCYSHTHEVTSFYAYTVSSSEDVRDTTSIVEYSSWQTLVVTSGISYTEDVIEGSSSFLDVLVAPYIEFVMSLAGDGLYSLINKVMSIIYGTQLRPLIVYLLFSCTILYWLTGNTYASVIISLSIIFFTKSDD